MALGHDVTLFASGDSITAANLVANDYVRVYRSLLASQTLGTEEQDTRRRMRNGKDANNLWPHIA